MAPDQRAAVPQICRSVPRRRLRRAAQQRSVRDRVLLPGAHRRADPHPARAGGRRGGKDRPVHQGDRKPGRLDDAAAWSAGTIEQRRFDGLRLLRQVPAITELAQLDPDRQGAAARLAARHGCGRGADRLFAGPQIHRSRGEEGLLRPGLFPPRVRALHDALARRHAPRCRRERRRGQSQADLGRGLADQGRRARRRLCGRRATAA